MPMESSNTFYSTSKNKGLIHFHKDHISFRLEADHAIRKTFYSEMDSISIQNKMQRKLGQIDLRQIRFVPLNHRIV